MTETPILQTHGQIVSLMQVIPQIYIDIGVQYLYKDKGVCIHMGRAASVARQKLCSCLIFHNIERKRKM